MTLLDVGCGWGGALERAVQKYDVNVIGITLSRNQCEYSRKRLAGFSVERVQLLRPHYARTLDMWAAKLVARRDEAIAITSEELYSRYLHYVTGCADFFRRGICNVGQFTLIKG